MPRTQRSVPPYPLIPTPPDSDASLASFCSSQSTLAHATFGPQHYEPQYAYPLIVWLHGRGDDERQLLRVMPHVSMRNYVAVAPAAIACRPREAKSSSAGCKPTTTSNRPSKASLTASNWPAGSSTYLPSGFF